jgi:hypothetical protein
LDFLKSKNLIDNTIITKTVEEEAKNALTGAVEKTIRSVAAPNLVSRYGIMVLQHLIFNDAMDKLDFYVEECSNRLSINRSQRELVKTKEIEPFLLETSKHTLRFIQPNVPGFISASLRNELTDRILESLPTKGVVYKGMPGDKDLTIMAEATLIYRKFEGKEKVYLASNDNHFKPNPIQIGSYNSSSMYYTGKLDSTVRDKIAGKFGFICEEPSKLLVILQEELKTKEDTKVST